MHEPHSSEVRRITHFVRVEVVMWVQSESIIFREMDDTFSGNNNK